MGSLFKIESKDLQPRDDSNRLLLVDAILLEGNGDCRQSNFVGHRSKEVVDIKTIDCRLLLEVVIPDELVHRVLEESCWLSVSQFLG